MRLSARTGPQCGPVEHDGRFLGWIARESARPLALALDDTPTPNLRAALATDTRTLAREQGIEQITAQNQVAVTISLEPAG